MGSLLPSYQYTDSDPDNIPPWTPLLYYKSLCKNVIDLVAPWLSRVVQPFLFPLFCGGAGA
jgi:hypothetical protein